MEEIRQLVMDMFVNKGFTKKYVFEKLSLEYDEKMVEEVLRKLLDEKTL